MVYLEEMSKYNVGSPTIISIQSTNSVITVSKTPLYESLRAFEAKYRIFNGVMLLWNNLHFHDFNSR